MRFDRSMGYEPPARFRKMMRRWSALFLVVVVAACFGGRRSARSGVQVAVDAAAIRATLDTTAAGWNRGDLPTYLSAYEDSATAMGPTGLVRGVNGIEVQMRLGYWRTGRPVQRLRYDHLEIRPIGPNQAIVTGQYILSGAGTPNRTGWFTTIWVRVPNSTSYPPTEWRMVHDHSS
jgi:ketosteroid isomerase-like protein